MWKILLYSFLLVNFATALQVTPISPMKFHKPFGLTYYNNKLYWGDYLFHSIFSYDLCTKKISQGEFPGGTFQPWYALPVENNPSLFYVNNGTTNFLVQWDGTSPTANIIQPTFSVENDIANHSLTYAKVAPNCDIVFGTLGTKLCVDQANSGTYVYNDRTGVRKILSNQIESGLVEWNADATKFYQLDPCASVVREYDYDAKTGQIFSYQHIFAFEFSANGRCVFKYQSQSQDTLKATMFGITVDTDGNLYLGIYHGGVVLVVNPRCGNVIRTINIPGPVIGSLTFGGKNRDILFVSTGDVPRDFFSGINLPGTSLPPGSGQIYAVTGLNARGVRQRPVCSKSVCHLIKCQNQSNLKSSTVDEE